MIVRYNVRLRLIRSASVRSSITCPPPDVVVTAVNDSPASSSYPNRVHREAEESVRIAETDNMMRPDNFL